MTILKFETIIRRQIIFFDRRKFSLINSIEIMLDFLVLDINIFRNFKLF